MKDKPSVSEKMVSRYGVHPAFTSLRRILFRANHMRALMKVEESIKARGGLDGSDDRGFQDVTHLARDIDLVIGAMIAMTEGQESN